MFRNPQVNISWPFGRSISNHVLWFWVVPPWVVALLWTLPWNIPRSATDSGGVEEQGADDGWETHWRQSGNWQKQDNWVRARVNISQFFVGSKVWYTFQVLCIMFEATTYRYSSFQGWFEFRWRYFSDRRSYSWRELVKVLLGSTLVPKYFDPQQKSSFLFVILFRIILPIFMGIQYTIIRIRIKQPV